MRSDVGAVVDDGVPSEVCASSSTSISADPAVANKACASIDVRAELDSPETAIDGGQVIGSLSTQNTDGRVEIHDAESSSSSEDEDEGLTGSQVASLSDEIDASSTAPHGIVVHRVQPAPALVEPQRERFLTAYERLSYDLANDRRYQKEITLGKRIGFYQLRSQIGCGNFSYVKLGVHILTRGEF